MKPRKRSTEKERPIVRSMREEIGDSISTQMSRGQIFPGSGPWGLREGVCAHEGWQREGWMGRWMDKTSGQKERQVTGARLKETGARRVVSTEEQRKTNVGDTQGREKTSCRPRDRVGRNAKRGGSRDFIRIAVARGP